jgi:TM2 domain-containing membrane protein YozV
MQDERVWVLEDPDERPRVRSESAVSSSRPQKNPAVAFTLSIFIWGAVQFYNRQGNVGTLLVLLMANFVVDPILVWIYREPIVAFLRGLPVTSSQMLAAITLFYFSGLLIWLSGAERAYHKTNAARTEPFQGTRVAWLPAVCSFLLPGWGQFLNGQAGKGALFLFTTLLVFFAAPTAVLIWLFWPELETAADRLFWERMLAATLLAAPLALVVWPLNCLDALRVGRDEVKKEPLLKRLEYANNRRRMYGWERGVFPFFRRTVMFAVVLVLCSSIAYFAFPQDYYVSLLQDLQTRLSQRHMVLIPHVIDRLLQLV